MKSGYKPQVYERWNRHDQRIPKTEQAEATADYLSFGQWAPLPTEATLTAQILTHPLNKVPPQYNTGPIEQEELTRLLANMKTIKRRDQTEYKWNS